MTVLRILHVLSACVWVGGTVALVFVGVPAIRRLEGEGPAGGRGAPWRRGGRCAGRGRSARGRGGRRVGWRAMAVAILSGLWLTERHGGLHRAALDTDFDRTLILKSVLVALLAVGALLHDFVLGPRLQRELHAAAPSAPATRRQLVVVGWFNFGLTIA